MISNKPLDLVFTSEYRKLTETEKISFLEYVVTTR